MPHYSTTEERRLALASTDGAEREALMAETQAYLAAAHLTHLQFATMLGVGVSTLNSWFRGAYHEVARSDRRLRARIRLFLDSNPIEPVLSAQGKLYETENVLLMREWFARCLAIGKRKGRMACIYAGPGSQKTFVAEHLIAELNRKHLSDPKRPRAFYIYCSQDERPLSMIHKCLRAAGLPATSQIQRSLAALRFHLRTTRSLFIFDEGQHLSIPCLEYVRELNDNAPFFGIWVLGSHRLRAFMDQRAAEMEQWHSRTLEAIELPGIEYDTIAGIVRAELCDLFDFTTPKAQRKVEGLLKDCLVKDIFSREKNKQYYSVRKVFDAIEQIRDAALARKGVIQ